MKIRSIILSIYITLLAVMPCCAFDNCPDDKAATEQSAFSNHDQGDEDGCGTCSPFFNCSTCNVSIVVASATRSEYVPICLINHFPDHYASAILKNVSGKIWQPPKSA